MRKTTSLTCLCFSFALLAAACGSDSKEGGGGAGAAGALSTGGADSGSGGATNGSGGDTSGSGGMVGSGGTDMGSGGSIVGSGGASGGTTSGGGSDGGAGAPVEGGTPPGDGAAPFSCRSNADCADVPGKLLCDVATGVCIDCHTNAQCEATEECVGTHCVKLPECANSLDCASASGGKTICDKTNGVCVQCTTSQDCGDGHVCSNRVCRTSCGSDNDCSAQQMLCNKGFGFNGQCTECVATSDCKDGQYCETGRCVPQTCTPGQQACDGDTIVECNESGSGVTPINQCTLLLFSSCLVEGDKASCVGACENQRKDALEADVDCGGPNTCPRCAAGKDCTLPTDCKSGKCTKSKCQ